MKRKLVAPKSGTDYIDLPPNPGGVASIDAEGNMVIKDSSVRSVGVASLAEIIDYRIVAIVDSISHHARFCNVGELYYVFNRRGELVELMGRAVCVSISPEGDCLYRALIIPEDA
jgi:hypothetical protein